MRDDTMTRMHQVTLLDTGESFLCGTEESVLHGMNRLGRRGIPMGCRGGGCGVCKVQVLSGTFHAKAMSRDHVSAEEQAQGQVLACRICPESDVQLQVLGRLKRCLNGRQPHTDTVSTATTTVFDHP